MLRATHCIGKGLTTAITTTISLTTTTTSSSSFVGSAQARKFQSSTSSFSSSSSSSSSSSYSGVSSLGRTNNGRYSRHMTATVPRSISTPSSAGMIGTRFNLRTNPRANNSLIQLRHYAADAENVVVPVPNMGDSISSGTINTWLKKVGDSVIEDDIVCQIDTDKVTADVRSPVGGVITEAIGNPQDNVNVGDVLFKVKKGAAAAAAAATPGPAAKVEPAKPAPPQPAAAAATPGPVAATSVPKVEAAKPAPPESAPPKPTPQPAAPKPVVDLASPVSPLGTRSERRVPMSRMRLRIAERLKDSQNTSAMLTTFNEVDMTKLMDLRNKFKDDFEKKHGVKLGFMSAFVKASAMALKEQPNVNAVIDGKDIVYRDFIDISVAVATPTGLVVPVIRDCQERSFASIEKTIGDFGERARVGKLAIEEMQGGTFTISNGGVFGSLYGTPIINPPQSAILGMHTVKWRPICDPENNNAVVARPMMYLALTYDHRLIDGKDAVTFLVRIKNMIEDPRRFLLEL